ncbi:MAG TPA: response regulator [Sedimenticola sp.]|nr:response regulator [Sedimenticola sp.]
MSIRTKFLLLLIMPFIGMGWFGGQLILEKRGIVEEMNSMGRISDLTVLIGDLVHETQKERGTTAGFLSSKGTRFQSQMALQRRSTDRQFGILLDFLQGHESKGSAREFPIGSSVIRQHREATRDLRKAVDALTIPHDDALRFYSSMNSSLLERVEALSKPSGNAKLAALSRGYINFLLAKEFTGIERAILTKVFTDGWRGSGERAQFWRMASRQTIFFNKFLITATPEQAAFYREKMSAPAVIEVDRMEKAALGEKNASRGRFNIDPQHWFTAMTQKIDLLKEVETRLSTDLKGQVSAIRGQAIANLSVYVAITLAALLGSLVFGLLLIRQLLAQIGGEPAEVMAIANRVAAGDLSVSFDPSAERTGIYAAVRNMVNSFSQVIRHAETIAQGDYSVEVQPRSDKDILALSLSRMTHALRRMDRESRNENWLRGGLSSLHDMMQGVEDREDLARKILGFLGERVDAPAGAIFLSGDDGLLQCAAATAWSGEENRDEAERAAATRDLVRISAPAEKPVPGRFRVGAVELSDIYGLPLISSGRVVGVLVLGTRKPLSRLQQDFLHRAANRAALAVEVGDSRAKLASMLEQSREQARALDQANRYKSEFLARMSHEIRTPMNSIIGSAQLALEAGLSKKQWKYVHTIHSSAQMLMRIINDILDFSKVEAGKLSMEAVPFDLGDLFSRLGSILQARIHNTEVDILFSLPPEVPHGLVGDPGRLRQILTNLIGNAAKFTKRGEITISAKLIGREAKQVTLQFSVRDTGMGMDQDQIERLFQPFEQADRTIAQQYGGTGLGLSICKQLVELMGGRIWAESSPGAGSTFHFTACFGLAAEVADTLPGYARRAVGLPRAITGLRILLVDDHRMNREMAEEILANRGCIVETALNGEEAVQAVRQAPDRYDLVLMDIQMPVMGGIEAARLILESPHTHEIPIIAMTAAATAAEVQECLEAGMVDHVAKPIDVEELHDKLIQWGRPRKRAAPAADEQPADGQDDESHLPQRLPGIDTVAGLRVCDRNVPLFLKVMSNFLRDHADAAETIRGALAKNDPAAARELAHNLKGAAGSIGARELGTIAAETEQALKRGETNLPGLLERLEKELETVCASGRHLAAWMEPPASQSGQATPSDHDRPARLLEELEDLLKKGDIRADEQLRLVKAALKGDSRHQEALSRLEDCIDRLDPQEAMVPLRQILEDLENP